MLTLIYFVSHKRATSRLIFTEVKVVSRATSAIQCPENQWFDPCGRHAILYCCRKLPHWRNPCGQRLPPSQHCPQPRSHHCWDDSDILDCQELLVRISYLFLPPPHHHTHTASFCPFSRALPRSLLHTFFVDCSYLHVHWDFQGCWVGQQRICRDRPRHDRSGRLWYCPSGKLLVVSASVFSCLGSRLLSSGIEL